MTILALDLSLTATGWAHDYDGKLQYGTQSTSHRGVDRLGQECDDSAVDARQRGDRWGSSACQGGCADGHRVACFRGVGH